MLLGHIDEAVTHYREALRLRPNDAEAHDNLGSALQKQGSDEEAAAHHRQALALNPNFAEAHTNLGNVLAKQDQLHAAATHHREAIRLDPNLAEAHANLGGTLLHQGDLDAALAHYRQALQIRPNFAQARWHRAVVCLLRGDFEQGWEDYEWRLAENAISRPTFTQPLWDGSDLHGQTILLHAEQGLGDTLQFIRYAPLVKQRGGRVVVECQSPLVRLTADVAGIEQVVARGTALPAFDFHLPLLSLPRVFRTTLANIPSCVPYLRAEPDLVEKWRRELGALHGLKVGIAWQGSRHHERDRQRLHSTNELRTAGGCGRRPAC